MILFTHSRDAIVAVVIYSGWEWQKPGAILRADVGTDDKDIMKKAKWEVMDKTTVRAIFEYNQTLLDKLAKAKLLTLDFEDDEDNSVEIHGSLLLCWARPSRPVIGRMPDGETRRCYLGNRPGYADYFHRTETGSIRSGVVMVVTQQQQYAIW